MTNCISQYDNYTLHGILLRTDLFLPLLWCNEIHDSFYPYTSQEKIYTDSSLTHGTKSTGNSKEISLFRPESQQDFLYNKFKNITTGIYVNTNETKKSEAHSVVPNSLRPYGLYSLQNSPCQDTGVGSCSLLQGILPTQGLSPGLPHGRQMLHQLSHQKKLKLNGSLMTYKNFQS